MKGRNGFDLQYRRIAMKKNQPTYTIYQVIEREKDLKIWTRIGVAWMHQDGEGFNLVFDAKNLEKEKIMSKNKLFSNFSFYIICLIIPLRDGKF